MAQVKKLFGEFPEKVVVLAETVQFDENGEAEVSDEVAEVLAGIPGYEIDGGAEPVEPGVDQLNDPEASEADRAPAAPKKKAPTQK